MIPIWFQGGLTPGRPAMALSLIFLVFWGTGCGGSSGTGPAGGLTTNEVDLWPAGQGGGLASAREGCDVLSAEARPGGNFVFALTDSVQPGRAPIPHNHAERVVFAQLYETLVQVDCAGSYSNMPYLPRTTTRWPTGS